MVDIVTIKSSQSSGELKLSDPKPPTANYPVEYLRVILKDREIVTSSSTVYIYKPYDLAAYFEDLAASQKGWDGAKQWYSVEEDFVLSSSFDISGHIAMEVTLKSGVYEDEWIVQAIIHIDVGDLEEIALRVKAFLHA